MYGARKRASSAGEGVTAANTIEDRQPSVVDIDCLARDGRKGLVQCAGRDLIDRAHRSASSWRRYLFHVCYVGFGLCY